MILGAVWGLLTSTRLLRGEEDSGRWDLLLCGQTTRRGATAQAIAGLGAGTGDPLGGHRDHHHGALGTAVERRNRRRSLALLLPGHGGHRRHVPRRRGRDQPTGGHPPPGGLVRAIVPRGQLRPAADRRRRCRPPRADLDLTTRLGGGAPAPHLAPTLCPRAQSSRSPRSWPLSPCTSPALATPGRASWRTGPRRGPPRPALRSDGTGDPPDAGHGHRLVGGHRPLGVPLRVHREIDRRHDLGLGQRGVLQAGSDRDTVPTRCSVCASSSRRS